MRKNLTAPPAESSSSGEEEEVALSPLQKLLGVKKRGKVEIKDSDPPIEVQADDLGIDTTQTFVNSK